ncbi:hypothetical protein HN371_02650 [Candidatus Poribacteria bacterium]|jgi:hypothetical protein|nr:hypothetical protein [Candidatus Poribacteria bacterium]MBT5534177.1 hypothetical protein [Candidatus Poribacteria bacterium]MBT5710194.1 hypothetical protein [Candidatus Poribacteria bacterium]MBT7096261.1 hypothetical protein [Candidatus Poribacteria bacterium]MBT7804448.1 hypothetical protein [Candidatus Poribacteria bacterium]
MSRQDVLAQITEALGGVPGWLSRLPDDQLTQTWGTLGWMFSDTALTSREKALISYGAAAAVHCTY